MSNKNRDQQISQYYIVLRYLLEREQGRSRKESEEERRAEKWRELKLDSINKGTKEPVFGRFFGWRKNLKRLVNFICFSDHFGEREILASFFCRRGEAVSEFGVSGDFRQSFRQNFGVFG